MFAQYFEIILSFLKAFLVGGLICMIAQIVINLTDLTAGKILVIFMLSGVALQTLGLYQYIVDFILFWRQKRYLYRSIEKNCRYS